jgi:hypothetical protein
VYEVVLQNYFVYNLVVDDNSVQVASEYHVDLQGKCFVFIVCDKRDYLRRNNKMSESSEDVVLALSDVEVKIAINALVQGDFIVVRWVAVDAVEDDFTVGDEEISEWKGKVLSAPVNGVVNVQYDGNPTIYDLPNEDIAVISITKRAGPKAKQASYFSKVQPKINQFNTWTPWLDVNATVAPFQRTSLKMELQARHNLAIEPVDKASRGKYMQKMVLINAVMAMVEAVHEGQLSPSDATRTGGAFCKGMQVLLIELEADRVGLMGGSRKDYAQEASATLSGPLGTYDKLELKTLKKSKN